MGDYPTRIPISDCVTHRPDPQPDDLEGKWQAIVDALLDAPLGDYAVAGVAAILADLPETVVRADRVRTQGRVSLSRSRAWKSGITVYIDVGEMSSIDEDYINGWKQDDDATTALIEDSDWKRDWHRVDWDNVEDVAHACAYVIWNSVQEDGNLASLIDPGIQLLLHAASERGDDIQVRRGVRSEGRVRFDAEPGDPGVVLWIPEKEMERMKPPTSTEQHIQSAFGESPLPPRRASRRHEPSDPEKL